MATANEGLQYLDSRKEFWQQEQPVYARRNKEFTPKKLRKKSANKMSEEKKQEKLMKKINMSEISQNALFAN